MAKGTLYLVPVGLGGESVGLLPPVTLEIVRTLGFFIAESPKSARAFLKAAGHPRPLQELTIETLDEHTPADRIPDLLQPLEQGTHGGLMSEAGAPAVADPGAPLVRHAHKAGIKVVPLVGPCAPLLALMASGLNGQRFSFHGYLPVERGPRAQRVIELEKESEAKALAQIFIEAPYRNDAMLATLLETCRSDTLLCIAADLTLPREFVRTRTIGEWKTATPELNRRPAVFVLYRDSPQRAQKR